MMCCFAIAEVGAVVHVRVYLVDHFNMVCWQCRRCLAAQLQTHAERAARHGCAPAGAVPRPPQLVHVDA